MRRNIAVALTAVLLIASSLGGGTLILKGEDSSSSGYYIILQDSVVNGSHIYYICAVPEDILSNITHVVKPPPATVNEVYTILPTNTSSEIYTALSNAGLCTPVKGVPSTIHVIYVKDMGALLKNPLLTQPFLKATSQLANKAAAVPTTTVYRSTTTTEVTVASAKAYTSATPTGVSPGSRPRSAYVLSVVIAGAAAVGVAYIAHFLIRRSW